MKTTIATVEKVARVMAIAHQRALGAKPKPFASLPTDHRAFYRAQAEAALRTLTPLIDRAEKRAWSKGWDAGAASNGENP